MNASDLGRVGWVTAGVGDEATDVGTALEPWDRVSVGPAGEG